MPFCANCGRELSDTAKFCPDCGEKSVMNSKASTLPKPQGKPIFIKPNVSQPQNAAASASIPGARTVVYEGVVHKCSNCGEVLDAYVSRCPSCGISIRYGSGQASVKRLVEMLTAIDQEPIPDFSRLSTYSGDDPKADAKRFAREKAAFAAFERRQKKKKVALILNHPIPNTKEDLIDFMMLASTNVDPKKGVGDPLSKAWLSKMDEVVNKARMVMAGDPDLRIIEDIYDSEHGEIHRKRFFVVMNILAGVFLYITLLVCIFNRVAAAVMFVVIVCAWIAGFIYVKKPNVYKNLFKRR